MAKLNIKSLLLLLLFTLYIISIRGGSSSTNSEKVQNLEIRQDDSTTITNPANFPPYTPPTVVTIPASNPSTVTPANPISTPATTTVPATTSPMPVTNPAAPLTNPATTYPTPTQTPAGTSTNVPVTPGQTWCIARAGAPESSLQSALDYACGKGADCSSIQQGAACYNPNTLQNHASYAFNSYYQNNPAPTSCDFGGAAMLVNTNPNSGACVYPSSATGTGTGTGMGTGTPASTYPPATTSSTNGASGSPYGGTTGSPYVVPPTGTYGSPFMNTSNPTSGFPASYGPDSPPGSSFPAGSATNRPCVGLMILVASLSTTKLLSGL